MITLPDGIQALNQQPARQTALLFTFSIGGLTWCYTNQRQALTVGGRNYVPTAITFQEFHDSGTSDDRPVRLNAEQIEPFATYLGHDIPTEIILEIRRVWLADLNFTQYVFKGSVDNVSDADEGLTIECRTVLGKLDQKFPALIVGATCTLETYSPQCGMNRDDYLVAGQIVSIERNAVVVEELADKAAGWASHGYAEARGIKLGIEYHTGSTMQMTIPPTLWQVGDVINIYAGDDHNYATCRDKFDNEINFLGIGLGMPNKNPIIQKLL